MKKISVPLYCLFIVFLVASCSGGSGGGNNAPSTDTPGTATLTWTAPTQNVDDSQLTDLKGYKIYYSYSGSGHYDHVIDVGNVTTFRFTDLPAGQCFFIVRAYNQAGVESDLSNEQGKMIN